MKLYSSKFVHAGLLPKVYLFGYPKLVLTKSHLEVGKSKYELNEINSISANFKTVSIQFLNGESIKVKLINNDSRAHIDELFSNLKAQNIEQVFEVVAKHKSEYFLPLTIFPMLIACFVTFNLSDNPYTVAKIVLYSFSLTLVVLFYISKAYLKRKNLKGHIEQEPIS